MKIKLIQLIALLFLCACMQEQKETSSANAIDSARHQEVEEPLAGTVPETPWEVKIDPATQQLSMTEREQTEHTQLTVDQVTKALNLKYPEIQLIFEKQSRDTVYVKIPDASYLTQQGGSMGAQIYLAESTYSFTHIAGIKFVNFDFEEGDHASPGTFDRSKFDFKK